MFKAGTKFKSDFTEETQVINSVTAVVAYFLQKLSTLFSRITTNGKSMRPSASAANFTFGYHKPLNYALYLCQEIE